MRTIVINNPGPQGSTGPQGVAGPSGSTQPFNNVNGDTWATTSSLQVSGSFLVSGSSTFTNIGPAIFSGSATITGATTMSSAVVSGDVTVLGTASINVLQINTTVNSTGSNTLGDNANDTQTLYGTVVIPTGSLTVSGTAQITGNINLPNQYQYIGLGINDAIRFANAEVRVSVSTATGNFSVYSPSSGSTAFRVIANGNTLIGTTTDAGYKLDVNGSTRVKGNFDVYRSDGNYMLGIGDSGAVFDWNPNNTSLPTFRIRGNATTVLLHIKSSEDRIGMGTLAPNASAMLDITSTNKGFLPPRTATTASITSPAQGLITYLTGSTNEGLYYYNSGSQVGWHRMLTNTGSQSITGSLTVTGGITMPNFSTIISQNNQINFETFRTIFYTSAGTVDTQYGFNFDDGGGSNTSTSGTTGRFQLSSRFAPTSGTAVYNTFLLNAIINQTGGANGITRGLYINPTLTSAANFRAIETTSGSVIFNHGSTSLMLVSSSGTIRLGNSRAIVYPDQINALQLNTGATYGGNLILINGTNGAGYVGIDGTGAWNFEDGALLLNANTSNKSLILATQGVERFRISGTTGETRISGSLRVSGSSRLLGSIDMTGPGVDGDGSDRFIYGGRTNQTASIQLFNPQTGRVHINPWNNSGVTITGSLDVSGNLTFNGSIALGNDQAITNPAGAFYKLYDGATGNSIIRGATSSDGLSRIRLQTGTSATDRLVVFGTGNITVGPNTDLGSRLGIRGSGTTNATTALRVENTNATASLVVLDNGYVGINTGSAQYNLDVSGTGRFTGNLTCDTFNLFGSVLTLNSANIGGLFGTRYVNSVSYAAGHVFQTSTGNVFATSGDTYTLQSIQTVAFTSGTATYTSLRLAPTISQTGGANGITRGLFIDPTLTSAANFRAIETTSGSVIFNHGSTPLMFISSSGNVGINTTASSAYTLDVNGNSRINGQLTCGTINPSTTTNVSGMTVYQGTIDPSTNYDLRLVVPTAAKGVVISQDYSFLSSSSALLEVKSTTKGFLPPRMTNAQRTAISTPAVGLMVYCTDATEGLYIYKSTGWTFIV